MKTLNTQNKVCIFHNEEVWCKKIKDASNYTVCLKPIVHLELTRLTLPEYVWCPEEEELHDIFLMKLHVWI